MTSKSTMAAQTILDFIENYLSPFFPEENIIAQSALRKIYQKNTRNTTPASSVKNKKTADWLFYNALSDIIFNIMFDDQLQKEIVDQKYQVFETEIQKLIQLLIANYSSLGTERQVLNSRNEQN